MGFHSFYRASKPQLNTQNLKQINKTLVNINTTAANKKMFQINASIMFK